MAHDDASHLKEARLREHERRLDESDAVRRQREGGLGRASHHDPLDDLHHFHHGGTTVAAAAAASSAGGIVRDLVPTNRQLAKSSYDYTDRQGRFYRKAGQNERLSRMVFGDRKTAGKEVFYVKMEKDTPGFRLNLQPGRTLRFMNRKTMQVQGMTIREFHRDRSDGRGYVVVSDREGLGTYGEVDY